MQAQITPLVEITDRTWSSLQLHFLPLHENENRKCLQSPLNQSPRWKSCMKQVAVWHSNSFCKHLPFKFIQLSPWSPCLDENCSQIVQVGIPSWLCAATNQKAKETEIDVWINSGRSVFFITDVLARASPQSTSLKDGRNVAFYPLASFP